MKIFFANVFKDLASHYRGGEGKRGLLTLSVFSYMPLYFGTTILLVSSSVISLTAEQFLLLYLCGLGVVFAVILPFAFAPNLPFEFENNRKNSLGDHGHSGGILISAKYTALTFLTFKTALAAYLGYALLSMLYLPCRMPLNSLLISFALFSAVLLVFSAIFVCFSAFNAPAVFLKFHLVFFYGFVVFFVLIYRIPTSAFFRINALTAVLPLAVIILISLLAISYARRAVVKS